MREPPRAGGHYGIPSRERGVANWASLFYPPPPIPEVVFYDASIWSLEIGLRACRCLHDGGIFYIGDLIEKTPDQLLRIKNLGPTTLREIEDALGKLKLHLYGVEL